MDCKSKPDMLALAHNLVNASQGDRLFLASSIAGEGLMRPQWWLRAAVAFGAWRSGLPKGMVWAQVLMRHPEIVDQTIEATADWIANGKDADGEGVGGFNQREVNRLVMLLGR